jgi:hypothetical protein
MPVPTAKMLGSKMMSSAGKPTWFDQDVVGAGADLDLALERVGLALLVERHDHDRGAVAADLLRVLDERLDAFLHRDRVDDRLAGDALSGRLDHAPLRAVDHDRHPGDVGLRGDQLEEGLHGVLRIEQALVHVDVDDLRAGLDLLARDLDGGGVVALQDQLLESRRAGDVGALADIDEGRGALGSWEDQARATNTRVRIKTRHHMKLAASMPDRRSAGGRVCHWRGLRPFTASATALMCAGVVRSSRRRC